jgi:transcription antitermination factor NusA-like protein
MLKKLILKLLSNAKVIKISIDSDKDGEKAFYAEVNPKEIIDELIR